MKRFLEKNPTLVSEDTECCCKRADYRIIIMTIASVIIKQKQLCKNWP